MTKTGRIRRKKEKYVERKKLERLSEAKGKQELLRENVKAVLAHHLQRRTASKIQNGRQGAPKWPTGSRKVSTPRFLGILSIFC